MENTRTQIIICIPIYRDWDSVAKLIEELDRVLLRFAEKIAVKILLVDDGAEENQKPIFENPIKFIEEVGILRLRRNLGHQRAIAIGLSYIQASMATDAVLVMDGDGEDTPEGVVVLLQDFIRSDRRSMIFAKRRRRTETVLFRVFYQLYRLLHSILTGRNIQVGNFSILPIQHLDCLVTAPELWNHYAASVVKLKLASKLIPIDRGYRIAGRSTMNFVSFVVHGLSAISVYAEEVGVRLMVFCAGMIALLLFGLIGIILIKFLTDYAIPGWATNAFGLSFSMILQLLVISMFIVVIILKTRSSADFLPTRDFQYFIKGIETVI